MTDGGPAKGTQLDENRFRAVLDGMFDEVAIGEAIRDDDGQIVDFVMVHLNAATLDGAGRSAADLVGRTVCESFPGWAESGLLDRFRNVVETGRPFVADRVAYTGATPDGTEINGHWSMSVSRFGDGYIAASRDVSALVAAEEAERAVQLDLERNRMAADLLRRAALPTRLPDVAGLDIAARYESAADIQPVGGDWYDAFELPDGRVGLVIADVTGHGPDAAAFMVQVRNIVRALAFEHTDPDVVLTTTNRVVSLLGDEGLYATCCIGVLSPADRLFTWASAGHFLPVRLVGASEVPTSEVGPPLGVHADATYRSGSLRLSVGDVLLLFTDGLVEDRTQDLQVGLEGLVGRSGDVEGASAADLADRLVASTVDRSDDLAVICVRITA